MWQSFDKVNYHSLNAKQKENFNFQKVSTAFADYGFNCIQLTDDWNGAAIKTITSVVRQRI